MRSSESKLDEDRKTLESAHLTLCRAKTLAQRQGKKKEKIGFRLRSIKFGKCTDLYTICN